MLCIESGEMGAHIWHAEWELIPKGKRRKSKKNYTNH